MMQIYVFKVSCQQQTSLFQLKLSFVRSPKQEDKNFCCHEFIFTHSTLNIRIMINYSFCTILPVSTYLIEYFRDRFNTQNNFPRPRATNRRLPLLLINKQRLTTKARLYLQNRLTFLLCFSENFHMQGILQIRLASLTSQFFLFKYSSRQSCATCFFENY